MLREWIRQHPWWSGLVVSVVVFVLNGIRRWRALEARMPFEQKLELRLLGAARALRKLGRAKRLAARCQAVRAAAPGMPMPAVLRRLSRASADARDAASRLSAVLRKIPDARVSIQVLMNLDRRTAEAYDVRNRCRVEARSLSTPTARTGTVLSSDWLQQGLQEVERLVAEARQAVADWSHELTTAAQALAVTVDAAIVRSGGVFRNPLKPETAVEDAQTRSILALRQSQEDLGRALRCVAVLDNACVALRSVGSVDSRDVSETVGAVLDEIDACLGEAELPLPAALADAESPYDSPDMVPSGVLQQVYSALVEIEGAAWASTWEGEQGRGM